MRHAHVRSLVVIAALALGALGAVGGTSIAGDDSFQIITSPDLKLNEVDRDWVRDVYLKKVTDLDGHTLHPVQLSARYPASEHFTRDVIRKTPAQLKSYWNQQIFSGKGVPPPEVESTAAAIAYVIANPGTITFIPSNADPGGARVVRLK